MITRIFCDTTFIDALYRKPIHSGPKKSELIKNSNNKFEYLHLFLKSWSFAQLIGKINNKERFHRKNGNLETMEYMTGMSIVTPVP